MAFSTTYDRLLTIAAEEVGLDRANLTSDDSARLLEVPNQALDELTMLHPWQRLRKQWEAQTVAPYSTGTVTVADASATVTLAAGTFPTWAAGSDFTIDGRTYAVLTRDGDTQLTLSTNYDAGSAGSGKSYSLARGFVFLPSDFQRFTPDAEITFGGGTGYGPLCWKGAGWIDAQRSFSQTTGIPQFCAIGPQLGDGSASDGLHKLLLWPIPTAVHTLRSTYQRRGRTMSSGSDVPDVPLDLHRALQVAVRLTAREEFNRTIDDALRARLEDLVSQARARLEPTFHQVRSLPNVIAGFGPIERGVNTPLHPDYDADAQ